MSDLFATKAPGIMRRLKAEPGFGFDTDDAAAILGNIGGETGGFQFHQELNPLVKGSRGGISWCQWTGPRRREFEAWCKAKGLPETSDEAAYSFLVRELLTTEKRAVPALKAAKGLDAKTRTFCNTFLRPGVPHIEKRIAYAEKARAAYSKSQSNRAAGAVIAGTAGPAAAVAAGVDPVAVIAGLVAVAAAVGLFLFIRSKRNARKA